MISSPSNTSSEPAPDEAQHPPTLPPYHADAVLSLDSIIFLPELCPRGRLSKARIVQFADLYRAIGLYALPPITVTRVAELVDGSPVHIGIKGAHRMEGARETGLEGIPVYYSDAGTPFDIFDEAVQDDACSALPFTRTEKQAAIDRYLHERSDLSDVVIARRVGVAHTTVGRRRQAHAASNQKGSERGSITPHREPSPATAARQLLRNVEFVWDRCASNDEVSDILAAQALALFGAEDAESWLEAIGAWCQAAIPLLDVA